MGCGEYHGTGRSNARNTQRWHPNTTTRGLQSGGCIASRSQHSGSAGNARSHEWRRGNNLQPASIICGRLPSIPRALLRCRAQCDACGCPRWSWSWCDVPRHACPRTTTSSAQARSGPSQRSSSTSRPCMARPSRVLPRSTTSVRAMCLCDGTPGKRGKARMLHAARIARAWVRSWGLPTDILTADDCGCRGEETLMVACLCCVLIDTQARFAPWVESFGSARTSRRYTSSWRPSRSHPPSLPSTTAQPPPSGEASEQFKQQQLLLLPLPSDKSVHDQYDDDQPRARSLETHVPHWC